MSATTRTRLPVLLLRIVAAIAVVVAAFVMLDGPARGDVGEAAVASVADKQRLIALGTTHTCAVTDNGGVECWGNNADGQLGNGTHETSTTPQPVVGLTGARQISAGAQHTCALLQSGLVKCWGLNGSGQLGNSSTDSSTIPVLVDNVSGVTAIATGGFHSCALLNDGTARCWGQDGMGEVGDGNPGDFHTTAVEVNGLEDAVALAGGEFHTCAVIDDGTVKCWGHNGFGQLGDGTMEDRAVPTSVVGLPDPATRPALAITAGNAHTCVVVGAPMHAYCWGGNADGQLGHATSVDSGTNQMTPSTTPLLVQFDNDPSPLTTDPQTLAGTVSVSSGQFHTCAKVGTTAWCWGRNDGGQLGSDPQPDSGEGGTPEAEPYESSSYALPVPIANVAAVAAGGYHTCALAGANVRCLGYNFHGQLGGYAPQSSRPVVVTGIQGAQAVASGTDFACALLDEAPVERKPFCWGSNADGRLGSGSPVALTTIRQPVAGTGKTTDLDLGNGHGCLRLDGTTALQCWGRNSDGQIGDGTTTNRPTPVASVGDVTSSYDAGGTLDAAEQGFTCAVRGTGKASCWGENTRGQLGNGETGDSSGPVTVQYDSDPDPDEVTETDLTGVTKVAAGGFHACALLSSGEVRCWGLNSSGQLGDNTLTERHLAVLVQDDEDGEANTPLTGVADIVAGARHTCALLSSGKVRCWGRNIFGQLGDDTNTARNNATKFVKSLAAPGGAVADLSGVEDISAGDNHTCAERSDKGVVCWGDNAFLQSSGTDAEHAHGIYAIEPPEEDFSGDLVTSLSASRKNTCVTYIDFSVLCWGSNSAGQLGDGLGVRRLAPVLVGALPGVGGNHIPEPVNDVVDTTPGAAVTIDALANDTDPDAQTLTIVAVGPTPIGDAQIVAGQVEYTPGPGCYDETFTYTVSDGIAPVTATITVQMNCAPVAVADDATTPEDTAVDIAVLANDTDPEDDPLTVSVTAAPSHGTASVNADKTVKYTPALDFCSAPDDSFVYTIADGHGHEASATVTVTVDCGSDAPAPGNDAASTPEDTPVDIDVLANDTDADGDPLHLVSVGTPAHGTASVVAGKAHYVPTADYCGPDTFTYTVGDGGTTAIGTVNVNVICAGDSPTAANDQATTPEDTSVLVDVLANDTDPDPDPDNLTLGALGAPQHGSAVAEAGKVRYTPAADYCGTDSFTYTVVDDTALTATGTAEVSIGCVNDAPVATSDDATTTEDVTVHVHVLTNDIDVDGDSLIVSDASGASHGTLDLAINDAVAYTPDPGFCGADSFIYDVSDGNGGTDQGTVVVTVICVNDPVHANPVPNQTTPWGSAISIPLTATDADVPADPLAWSLVSGPNGASVTTAGQFLWTPGDNQLGSHQVTVAVSDGASSDQVTFTITVTKRATAVAYEGAAAGQVSDPASVQGLLTDAVSGMPLTGRPLTFSLGAASLDGTTDADGRASGSIGVTTPVGSKPVSVSYAGSSAYLPASASTTFLVGKENISLALGGQTLVLTSAASASTVLTADITEEADGSLVGALNNVTVSFSNSDGTLLCSGVAASTGVGKARATCTTSLPVGTRAVVLIAASATYTGLADVGVVTVANTGAGYASAAIGTGNRDGGFQARPVKKGAPTGDVVAVVPGFGTLTIVETANLTSLSTSCSGGSPRICAATLVVAGATLRTVNLTTGAVSPPSGVVGLRIDARDEAEPGSGTPPDTWALSVSGGVNDSLGTPASQVLIDYGNARVTP